MSNQEDFREKLVSGIPTQGTDEINAGAIRHYARFAFDEGVKYAQAQAAEKWIDVRERKPEVGEYVLLYNGFWRGVGKYMPEDEDYDNESDRVNDWQDETSEYIFPIPTHWQPLPALPIS